MSFDYWQRIVPGEIYHLYNKSVSGVKLFNDAIDYESFLENFMRYFSPYASIFAYCLIPNHFHFIVRIKDQFGEESLKKEKSKAAQKLLEGQGDANDFFEDQMRRFFSGYALRYNRKYDRKGGLFLKRVKRVIINSREGFEFKLCYVHHNPIHHGLCKEYHRWKYSSYNNFTNSEKSITKDEVYQILGDGNVLVGQQEFEIIHDEFKKNFSHEEYTGK